MLHTILHYKKRKTKTKTNYHCTVKLKKHYYIPIVKVQKWSFFGMYIQSVFKKFPLWSHVYEKKIDKTA